MSKLTRGENVEYPQTALSRSGIAADAAAEPRISCVELLSTASVFKELFFPFTCDG